MELGAPMHRSASREYFSPAIRTALTMLAAWLLLTCLRRELPLFLWLIYSVSAFFFFRFSAGLQGQILTPRQELALSFFFSSATTLGLFFDSGITFANVSLRDALIWIFCAAVLAEPVRRLLRLICRGLARWADREKAQAVLRGEASPRKRPFLSDRPARCFLFSLGLILLCWLPVWLAYFPGLWNYDPWQVDQVLSGVYSKHHPLLHTLLLGGCYRFALAKGNPSLAPLIYSAVQGGICASVFALAAVFIRQRTNSTLFFVLSLLFFALFPVHPILGISTTKDTLFSALILLAGLIFLLAEESAPGRRKLFAAAEIPVLALVILFRNNARYCFFLLILVCLVRVKRKQWRGILAVLTAGTLLGLSADRALGSYLNATPAFAAEMFSVPSQMAARVQEEADGLDPQTDEFLKTYYSLGDFEYSPSLADGTKKCLRLENRADLIGYLRGSLRLFLRYPAICMDAFLYTTEGLWNPLDVSHTRIYGIENQQGYLPTDIKSGYRIEADSLLPSLRALLEKLFTENAFLDIPVIHFLFAPAFHVGLLMLAICVMLRGKGRKRLPIPLFLFFLVMTIALGPGVLPRYIYPLMVCSPLLTWMCMKSVRCGPSPLPRGCETPLSLSEQGWEINRHTDVRSEEEKNG